MERCSLRRLSVSACYSADWWVWAGSKRAENLTLALNTFCTGSSKCTSLGLEFHQGVGLSREAGLRHAAAHAVRRTWSLRRRGEQRRTRLQRLRGGRDPGGKTVLTTVVSTQQTAVHVPRRLGALGWRIHLTAFVSPAVGASWLMWLRVEQGPRSGAASPLHVQVWRGAYLTHPSALCLIL